MSTVFPHTNLYEEPITAFLNSNRCNTTPPFAVRREGTFRVIKLGRYVIVDPGGKYVMFHAMNVRIKL